VDSNGSVFFTDVGNQTIWKLLSDGTLEAAVTDVWCHHLYVDDEDNLYFDAENYGGTPGNSFWKQNPSGERTELIPATPQREYGAEYTYLIESGDILFAGQWGVRSRSPNGNVRFLAGASGDQRRRDGRGEAARFGWITAMTRGPDGALYVIDVVANTDAALRRVTLDGVVETLATDLLAVPADDPFFSDNTFNLMWNVYVSADGTAYLAYTGNRRLLTVSPKAHVSEAYHAPAPWSPHGVTGHDGHLYILETAFVEGVGHSPPRVTRLSTDGTTEVLVTVDENGQ
jgi:hypothetical protein